MSPARVVDLVVPAGIADPRRPSGGNTYDRRLRDELASAGWWVRTREVGGDWTLADLPDESVVLVDGLVASGCPEVTDPAARRLRIVVLMHMPLPLEPLRAAAAVVTTSEWTRTWLLDASGLDPGRVTVARPGVDVARSARRSDNGGTLLCVGAVTPGKGQDALVAALARVADLDWRCVCVGPLDRDPAFVAQVRQEVARSGLGGRVELTGPLGGEALEAAYAEADLLVLPSRAEAYGMVVTEALARGLPVLAFDVGGVSEALGATPDGERPGVLVPAGDVAGLSAAVARWLDDDGHRRHLRDAAARRRRTGLSGWPETAARVARVLDSVQMVDA